MISTSSASLVSSSRIFASPEDRLPNAGPWELRQKSLNEWADTAGTDKELRSALVSKVQYIDFAMLKEALAEVATKVSEIVSSKRLVPTLYLGEKMWSSNKWITDGVIPALRFDTRNQGTFNMMPGPNQKLIEQVLKAGSNSFILFDDAIFSGQQIAMGFARHLKLASTELDPSLEKRVKEMHIILAPAYATSHGAAYAVESCRQFGFENVTLVTSKSPILTIGELFDESMVARIEKWRTYKGVCPLRKLSLTLFEHGIPDDESSLMELMWRVGQIDKPYRPKFTFGKSKL